MVKLYLIKNVDGAEFWSVLLPINGDERIIQRRKNVTDGWLKTLSDTDKDFLIKEMATLL